MHSRSSVLWRLDELTQLFVIGYINWIRLDQTDWWGPTELSVAKRFRRTTLLLVLVGTLDVFSLA